jgi:hypothetical protein
VVRPDEGQAAALYSSRALQQPGPAAPPERGAAQPAFAGYDQVVYHDVLGHVCGTWGGSVPQQPEAGAFLGSDTQVRRRPGGLRSSHQPAACPGCHAAAAAAAAAGQR